MAKLSHTILYADDTNIIVISTDCNDLHKTVYGSIQLISEWFQINKLVLNKNKILAINFSWSKTPTHTLYILETVMFVVKNPDSIKLMFQITAEI
jgi:6-phosphogluconate dehydrogenase